MKPSSPSIRSFASSLLPARLAFLSHLSTETLEKTDAKNIYSNQ